MTTGSGPRPRRGGNCASTPSRRSLAGSRSGGASGGRGGGAPHPGGARPGEAAPAATIAVRADPLRESARAALVRVYLAEGNQSDALGEFRRYRRLIRAELGLEPTALLGDLMRDLHPAAA